MNSDAIRFYGKVAIITRGAGSIGLAMVRLMIALNVPGRVLAANDGCASLVPGIAQFRTFFSGEYQ